MSRQRATIMACALGALLSVHLGTALAEFVPLPERSLVSSGFGFASTWVDMDGDGRLDLSIVSDARLSRGVGRHSFLLSTSDGFVDVTPEFLMGANAGRAIAWGDYDGDGDADAYIVHSGSANLLVRNEGHGSFSAVESTVLADDGFGRAAAWGDCDGDGDLDLYLVNAAGANKLFQNQGDGSFAVVESELLAGAPFARAAYWVDIDGDADLDLHTLSMRGPDRLLRNLGNGEFEDASAALAVESSTRSAAAWGDADGDGDYDVFVASYDGRSQLLFNDGSGQFADSTPAEMQGLQGIWSAAWVDVDRDGMLELFVVDLHRGNRLFSNNGDGSWTEDASPALTPTTAIVHSWVDVDRDGDLDLFTLGEGGGTFASNNALVESNWLRIALRGAGSNPEGLGATVQVNVAGRAITRAVDTADGSGYAGTDGVLVGLGTIEAVHSVVVRWPSGQVQTIDEVPINGHLVIEEPSIAPPDGDLSLHTDKQPTTASYRTQLLPGHPNPFNPSVNLEFELSKSTRVQLTIYDVAGRRVRSLVAGEAMAAGRHSLVWNGVDDRGGAVASGTYIAVFDAGDFHGTTRITMIK